MTSNGVDPDEMTAQERLGEAARILATGILRLRMKQEGNKPLKTEKVFLDVSPDMRLHGSKPQTNGE
jgi:hypothetical protein